MRLITTRVLTLNAQTLAPGCYTLERVPNPSDLPPGPYTDPSWLVVQGTTMGMAEHAWRHEYVWHTDPCVLLEGEEFSRIRR